MAKSKPCPFCGNKKVKVNPFNEYVECNKCGATGPFIENQFLLRTTKKHAIDAWNKRS